MADFTGTFHDNNDPPGRSSACSRSCCRSSSSTSSPASISAPLERLAFKVGKIQELGTEQLPSVASPIREICGAVEGHRHARRRREVVRRLRAGRPGHPAAAVRPEARAGRPQPLPHDLLLRPRGLLDPVGGDAVAGAAAARIGLSRAGHQDGQPGARHDRQVHRRRRDGLLGRAGAARRPCLAGLRGGAAHPARHGRAERALARRRA